MFPLYYQVKQTVVEFQLSFFKDQVWFICYPHVVVVILNLTKKCVDKEQVVAVD